MERGTPHSPGKGTGEVAWLAAVQEQHTTADPTVALPLR